ncbi:hypothetical protein DUI87_13052 [Hirundo rustica rustica]|uniref:Uncharacterized protein n=1 Tax=Hirundo rustica rustica TaxID=333673 RepID=A0A3M0KH36_HIRRU|nr:hypothetical protein DUI87_13052 [Hirundo rustica rustica]
MPASQMDPLLAKAELITGVLCDKVVDVFYSISFGLQSSTSPLKGVHLYKNIFDANGAIIVKEVIYKWIEKDLEQYMRAGDEVCAKLTGEPQEETPPNYLGGAYGFVK